MAATIGRDIAFRATIKDDTKQGAQSVKNSVQDVARAAERKKILFGEDGGHGGRGEGHGHLGRIFSDASTTGLDTLSRGLLSGVSEKLGTGLQLGVLAVASQTLTRLTEGAIQFTEEWRKGEMTTSGMAMKLAEQIPIYGTIVTAGENIREIFTGERYQLELQKKLTEDMAASQERLFAASLKNLETQRQYANELRQIDRDIAGVGLRGTSAEKHGIESAAESRKDQLQSDIEQAKHEAAIAAMKDPEQQNLDKFLNEHQAHMDQMRSDDEIARRTAGPSYRKDPELQQLEDQEKDYREKAKRSAEIRTQERDHRISKDEQALKKNEEKKTKDLVEFEKKRGERLRAEAASASAAHEQSQAATAAQQERTAGNMYAAQQKDLDARVKNEKEQATIRAQGRANATTNVQEQLQIASEWQQELADIEKKGAADRAQLAKDYGIERKRIQHDTLEAQADAQVAATAQRFREDGRGYDARDILENREHEKRLQNIDQQAQEEIARNKDNAAEIRQKAEADKAKENADFKDLQRQTGEQRRHGEFQIGRDVLQGQLDALRLEGQAGNAISAREAKKLDVALQYAEKRARLLDVINAPNASSDAKGAAKKQFSHLNVEQQLAERMAFFGGGYRLPSMRMAGLTTGLAAKGSEEVSREMQLHKLIQQGNSDAARTAKATEQLVAALKKIPVLAPIIAGVK